MFATLPAILGDTVVHPVHVGDDESNTCRDVDPTERVGGAGMVGVPEVVSRIFDVLTEKSVNVLMISQSSSMANISLVVQQSDVKRAFDALQAQFENSDLVKTIEYWEGIAVVAVVGVLPFIWQTECMVTVLP